MCITRHASRATCSLNLARIVAAAASAAARRFSPSANCINRSHVTRHTSHVTRHTSLVSNTFKAALAHACVCSAWISAAAASSRVFACFAADSASCLPRAACCTAAAAAAADRCMSCSAAFFCTRSSKTCTHQKRHACMRNSGCSQAIAFALQCRTSSCVSWGSWSPTPSCSSSTWGAESAHYVQRQV